MTFEEFRKLAENPPRLKEETIFEVIEYDVSPLPERKRSHYPRFYVTNMRVGFGRSLQEAESLMAYAVDKAVCNQTEIYCFHIKEYPVAESLSLISTDFGLSCRLYDHTGMLLDMTYCSYLDRDLHTKYGHFRGRPQESMRIKPGDIVEVLCGEEVMVAIATGSSPSIEWCWNLRERISKNRHWQRKDGKPLSDEEIDKAYFFDCSDDQITVVDGPEFGSHDHVSPLFLLLPRYPISKRLSAKLKSYE